MLHIKDIEAFARINEALFRSSDSDGRTDETDLSGHPAILLARMMAAAQTPPEDGAPSAEVVQLVPEADRKAVEDGAETVGSAAHDFDPAPAMPMTMAELISRMMFGRR